MDQVIRFLLKILTPIQKLMQKIGPPEPSMTKKQVDEILFLAGPGKVLHSRERLHLTYNFIKGFWKHSAIIARHPETGELVVVEAVGSGVQWVPIEEWLYKKSFVMMQEREGYEQEQLDDCGAWAFDQCGKKYDYEFSGDDKEFYCSELAADALDIKLDGILEPTELSERKELRTIYDSRKG